MADELLGYYDQELRFLRQMGAEYAQKYPKIASRLNLEADRCEDPHVERLLEGFALLAARIHKKLDDDLPEITEALLSVLLPHYVRPVPSMSVVQFHADPEQSKLPKGYQITKKDTLLSPPVQGVRCKFRPCYDTTFWPLTVSAAQFTSPERLHPTLKGTQAVAACRLMLTCATDISFESLDLRSLRFYLNGESALIHSLYELLFNNCLEILVRDPVKRTTVTLSANALKPLGFGEEDSLLPYPRRSFSGYRLLQEYFAFPEKFFFLELTGLEALAVKGFTKEAEIVFLISPFKRPERQPMFEVGVSEKTFLLNCAPVINLFSQTAEPIRLEETRSEYPVVPYRRDSMEVFSIDEVLASAPGSPNLTHFDPFYSIRHSTASKPGQAYWHATRKATGAGDGTEMAISLMDLSGRQVRPQVDTLTVRCQCSNRDLPARLNFGSDFTDLELQGASIIKRVLVLHKFTPSLPPKTGRDLLWRLISHLSLNYLSLVEEGKDALQEILRLYNFSDSPAGNRQIEGITAISSDKAFARLISKYGIHFARGTRVEMEIDEDQFVGGGAYLFGQVLEYFLGLYVSMNSFSQLAVTTPQRKGTLKEWPPRAGHRILL